MPTDRGDRARHVALERLPYDPVAWDAIVADHREAEVFHSAAWLEFLRASQGAEPVVAVVRADGRPVGHFVGAIVRRYGVRILGSPLRGWTTQCMGFLLEDGFDRRAAAEALLPFAFHDLDCLHVELADRYLTADQMTGSRYRLEIGTTYRVDLTAPEQVILGAMQPKTRQKIRKALRTGLRADVTDDVEFADDFHAYLRATFARQGLAPTYGAARVRQLIESLHGTGNLLLLRVRSPEGEPRAAGISVGYGRTAVSWGVGFDRATEDSNPTQLLWWETLRHWKDRGATCFDMGGSGDYKAKYGGVETSTVHFHRSRWAILRFGRSAFRRLVRARQILGGFRDRPRAPRRDRVGDE
jgi:CelD/BcsL family acetyltransferase involved in cellulose biosynthesis